MQTGGWCMGVGGRLRPRSPWAVMTGDGVWDDPGVCGSDTAGGRA